MKLGLLRDHDFRQLFLADTVSQLGSQVSMLALPLVAVLALSASAFQVGVLSACGAAAFLFIGLPAGAWVDRMRRRSVMLAGDAVRAVMLGSVPVAWWLGGLTMAQLYAVAIGVGAMTVFFDVAYQSYLPALVGRERLVEGNAKLQAVAGVAQIGGPTVAGFLVQALTAPVAVVVDALSYAGSAVALTRIRLREPRPERAADAHLGQEIREGLHFVLSNRILRSIAACTGVSNFFSALGGAMVTLFLVRKLHLAPGLIGVFFSIGSLGGLAGVALAQRAATVLGEGPAIWMSIAVCSPFELLLPLAHRGVTLWIAAVGAAVYAMGAVIYNINQVSFRQRLAPDRLLGRMNATMRFLVWGTLPIGAFVGGVLGTTIDIRPTLWVAAIGGSLAFVPVFLSPLRHARELPGPFGEPQSEPVATAA